MSNKGLFGVLVLFLIIFQNVQIYSREKELNLKEYSGTIKDAKNKKGIGNVNISLEGTDIGTVTNADGFFTIKIPQEFSSKGLKIDHIGYQSVYLSSDLYSRSPVNILLTPTGKVLDELMVLGGDPYEIVRAALRKIPENYSDKDDLFTGFYRETVQKGNRFINISEGVVDVLKKPYKYRDPRGEKVRIHKGRSLLSPRPSDTLSVKLMGGPFMPVTLDAVKNGAHLFEESELGYFEFKMDKPEMIDGRIHYNISFKPIANLNYPLNSGRIYIDGENLSISRVEFSMDMKDKGKVTRSILQKKPAGLNFKPIEVSGIVTYRQRDGKSYINYISSVMKFKCDWKKRLFSSTYTSKAEMVMTDREEPENKHVKFDDTFGSRNIFSDKLSNYWDENFWKDYNIIEPTESLEKAVTKLKK